MRKKLRKLQYNTKLESCQECGYEVSFGSVVAKSNVEIEGGPGSDSRKVEVSLAGFGFSSTAFKLSGLVVGVWYMGLCDFRKTAVFLKSQGWL